MASKMSWADMVDEDEAAERARTAAERARLDARRPAIPFAVYSPEGRLVYGTPGSPLRIDVKTPRIAPGAPKKSSPLRREVSGPVAINLNQ